MYTEILDKIANWEYFSFSRWWDWEFLCMKNNWWENCDWHTYFPELGKRLREILASKPEYILWLQWLVKQIMPKYMETFNIDNWVWADIFHYKSIDSGLDELIAILKPNNIVMVWPSYLKWLLWWVFIEIPDNNCRLSYKEILLEIKKNIDTGCVVIYCASMMANVLIDDIYKYKRDITQIDIGSAFDQYVWKHTRDYHKDILTRLDTTWK